MITDILFNMSIAFISSITFGIISDVPRKSIITGGCIGTLGWMGYWLLNSNGMGVFGSSFACSLLLAFAGQIAARIYKMPLTVFYVPGLVPVVPGITSYHAFRSFILGSYPEAFMEFLNVGFCAVGIASGIVVSDILFRILIFTIRQFSKEALQ